MNRQHNFRVKDRLLSLVRGFFPMAVLLLAAPELAAAPDTVTIAVAAPLSGSGKHIGPEVANAVQMAVRHANETGGINGAKLVAQVFDDGTSPDVAAQVAGTIIDGPALAVIGHPHSAVSLAAVPVYQRGGLAVLSSAAEGSLTTDHTVFFRIVPSLDNQGRAGANYVHAALGLDRATIVYRDDSFGRALMQSFQTQFLSFAASSARTVALPDGAADWRAVAAKLATDTSVGMIVMAMQDFEASQFLIALRRAGIKAPVMGSQAVAREIFLSLFKDQPEETATPGFFAEGIYAMAPAILDTANKDTLDFAGAYEARFGDQPGWIGIKYYEAARAVIQALRVASPANRPETKAQDRAAVVGALTAMTTVGDAAPGLTGPVLFDAHRNRVESFRVGQFQGGHFISAPIQFVPVQNIGSIDLPTALAADKIRKIRNDYFWRQRIVYTGIRPLSIDRIEAKDTLFSADFYMWMRFADRDGIANVEFPDMLRGSYNPKQPVSEHKAGGMTYLLYRIKGDFRNEFDFNDYPFDQQHLVIRLANYRMPLEEVIYAEDRLAPPPGVSGLDGDKSFWKAPAQWDPRSVQSFRDEIVAKDALGDPDALQSARVLEFSGFKTVLTVQRQVVVFLKKNLLALGLLTMVVYSTLFYPDSLLKERLTVPVAGILSASVLLAAVQNKLGDIGATTAAELLFYVFYFITLMGMLSALFEERLKSAGWPRLSKAVRWSSFFLYPATVLGALLFVAVKYHDRF